MIAFYIFYTLAKRSYFILQTASVESSASPVFVFSLAQFLFLFVSSNIDMKMGHPRLVRGKRRLARRQRPAAPAEEQSRSRKRDGGKKRKEK